MVAEIAVAGGLAAMRAQGRPRLNFSVPHSSFLRSLVNVATHGLTTRLRYVSALAGSAVDAQSLLLVPTVRAHPFVARRTFDKMRPDLLLRLVKRLLLLFSPLRALVTQLVLKYIRTRLEGTADAAYPSAKQVAEDADAPSQPFGAFFSFSFSISSP